jgi:hypothetical protein
MFFMGCSVHWQEIHKMPLREIDIRPFAFAAGLLHLGL